MGVTDVQLKVINPANPKKYFEGKFLVDSGAVYTVVPQKILKGLGIMPERVEEFSLVDGKIIKRKVGNAFFEFNGIKGAAPVMFGEKGDSLLMGVFTMESMGLVLDPLKRKLYKADLRL